MNRKIIVLALCAGLAACGKGEPTISISSENICDQGTEPLIRLAHECAQGGGKYPEDCIKAGVTAMCPDTTVFRVNFPDSTSSAWTPCAKAKSADAKAACRLAVR